MEGKINITYTIVCDNDIHLELPISEILSNEKVQQVIKREFAGNSRNVVLEDRKVTGTLIMEKEKKHYEIVIDKDDFADALTLAEEDAKKRKILKADCTLVELIDLVTIEENEEK